MEMIFNEGSFEVGFFDSYYLIYNQFGLLFQIK